MNQVCISSFTSLQDAKKYEKNISYFNICSAERVYWASFSTQAIEPCEATKVITAQFHLFSLLKCHVEEKYTHIPFKFNFPISGSYFEASCNST